MNKKKLKSKKKTSPKAKTIVWDQSKADAPKNEIIRIFPKYAKSSKKKQMLVLSEMLLWVSSELKRLCE
jgi:hypothetical protein